MVLLDSDLVHEPEGEGGDPHAAEVDEGHEQRHVGAAHRGVAQPGAEGHHGEEAGVERGAVEGEHRDHQGVVVAGEGVILRLHQRGDVDQGGEGEAHQQPEGVGPEVDHDGAGAHYELGDEEGDDELDGDHGQGQLGDLLPRDTELDQLEVADVLRGGEGEGGGEEDQDEDRHHGHPQDLPQRLVRLHDAELQLLGRLVVRGGLQRLVPLLHEDRDAGGGDQEHDPPEQGELGQGEVAGRLCNGRK